MTLHGYMHSWNCQGDLGCTDPGSYKQKIPANRVHKLWPNSPGD